MRIRFLASIFFSLIFALWPLTVAGAEDTNIVDLPVTDVCDIRVDDCWVEDNVCDFEFEDCVDPVVPDPEPSIPVIYPTEPPKPPVEPEPPVIDPEPPVIVPKPPVEPVIDPQPIPDPQPTVKPVVEPSKPVIPDVVLTPDEQHQALLDDLMNQAEQDDIQVPANIAAIPVLGSSIVALTDALNFVGNVGADMSPEVRKKAKQTLVSAVIVTQIAQLSTQTAMTAATASLANGSPKQRKMN